MKKFCSINEPDKISLNDTQIVSLKMHQDQMVIVVEGAIIKSGNSQNARFEDMYCMELEYILDGVCVQDFSQQGFKYYDADGRLLSEEPDIPLDELARYSILSKAQGAYVFALETMADGRWLLIFDIEDEEGDMTTYQILFTFISCKAQWDRYSGPVNGVM